MFKGYAVHEDNLINFRLNWSLVVNTFLFTGWAIMTQQFPTLRNQFIFPDLAKMFHIHLNVYFFVVVMMCIVGGLSAFFSLQGIRAAEGALAALENEWLELKRKFTREWATDNLLVLHMPSLLGGGVYHSRKIGLAYPTNILVLIMIAWIMIFLGNILALRYMQ